MSKLADVEKKDREERMAFQSNLASDVRSMLADFSRVRRKQARKARNEREAFLLEIKNQVTGLRKVTPQGKEEERVPKVKAVEPPVTALRPKVKAAEPPVTAKEPQGKEEKGWLRETFLRKKPGKAAAKAKRGKKKK